MQSQRVLSIASIVALAAGLSACAAGDPYGPNNYPVSSYGTTTVVPAPVMQQAGYVEYGRITNVSLVSSGGTVSGPNTTAGTVVGAVVGGALGSTIGGGSGRAVATVLGALGGAAVGNRLASNDSRQYNTAGPVYRVTVFTDQGFDRQYDVSASADLRVGDRVRIENGMIYQG